MTIFEVFHYHKIQYLSQLEVENDNHIKCKTYTHGLL